MANQQCPEPVEGWLTTLQAAFLTRFFATDTGQLFFLTGGTALAAYHLHHRLSVDLDLFTLDDLALRETDVLIPQLAADLGCRIGRARRTEHFRQFLLEPEAGESLQIDLVRDFGPQYGEHIKMGDIVVDSMENIGANKLTAILGRTEPKDVEEGFPRRPVLHPTCWVRFRRLAGEGSEKGSGLATLFYGWDTAAGSQPPSLAGYHSPAHAPRTSGFYHPSGRPAARPIAPTGELRK